MVFDVSLEMQSDSKYCVGVQDVEISEPVHTIKSTKEAFCSNSLISLTADVSVNFL